MNRNFSIFSICLRTLEQHNVHTLNNCFKVKHTQGYVAKEWKCFVVH